MRPPDPRMCSRVHTQVRTYGVFAIMANTPEDGYIIHIWRTRTTNLRKVLSNYRRKNGITTPFFEDGVVAEIYLLETVEADLATVYRHVVAWTHRFLELDYDVITHPATYEAAFDLQPETEAIYQQISRFSIPALIEHPYKHSKTTLPHSQEDNKKEQLTSRLSIRLTKTEFYRFTLACGQHNLTYREMLLALLVLSGETEEPAGEMIPVQKGYFGHWLKKTEIVQNSRRTQADEHWKQALVFSQKGIQAYLDHICSKPPGKSECLSWNQFVYSFPQRRLYQYPLTDGYFQFRIDRMCYGKSANAAIFLYGLDLDHGVPVKLRYYKKAEYCGVRPPHSGFFTEGTHLLVGCKVQDSGAADLLAAFPLSWTEKDSDEHTLDDILSSASLRSQLNSE